ncbi:MAG: Ig-like domain-containing protein [Oscillospiraceae bacterium]|nr:Ig-like domain-containing protein [Oscillospiraceae bacterium]
MVLVAAMLLGGVFTNVAGAQGVESYDIQAASAGINFPAVGGTFTDSGANPADLAGSRTVWRVLYEDANGNRLIIAEEVMISTQYNTMSGGLSWTPFPQSNLRQVLNNVALAPEIAANALVPNGAGTDVRATFGNFNAAENQAAGRTTAGARATTPQQALFVLSISEANHYFGSAEARRTPSGGSWWLRSPGSSATQSATLVQGNGSIGTSQSFSQHGLRPAIWVYGTPGNVAPIPVTGVTIAGGATRNVTVGQALGLAATVAPVNATNPSVTWQSGNPAVATVSAIGQITAVAPGTAAITVRTVDGNRTATVTVTVTEPTTPPPPIPVTSVTIAGEAARNLIIGQTLGLTPIVAPANATNQNVTWTSANPAIATVSATGQVTAVAPGATTVTVRTVDGNRTATATIIVTELALIPVMGVTIAGEATHNLAVAQTLGLTATVAPASATNPSVTWTSDNPAVATVTEAGQVTAVAPGTATITVVTVDGNHTAAVTVTVTEEDVPLPDCCGMTVCACEACDATCACVEFHGAYMVGDAQGNFRPSASITRAEVAVILARTHIDGFEAGTLPSGMTSLPFGDIETHWARFYIAWAYNANLVQGHGGNFRPSEFITRQEFAAILARAGDEMHTTGIKPFFDAGLISNWAARYVYTVYREGLMAGDNNRNFRPLADITRAEVATAVNRMLGRIDNRIALNAVVNIGAARPFPDVAAVAWYFPAVLAATNSHYLTRSPAGGVNWMQLAP